MHYSQYRPGSTKSGPAPYAASLFDKAEAGTNQGSRQMRVEAVADVVLDAVSDRKGP